MNQYIKIPIGLSCHEHLWDMMELNIGARYYTYHGPFPDYLFDLGILVSVPVDNSLAADLWEIRPTGRLEFKLVKDGEAAFLLIALAPDGI